MNLLVFAMLCPSAPTQVPFFVALWGLEANLKHQRGFEMAYHTSLDIHSIEALTIAN